MKILVLGAGATGGYFGGRLAEAGLDVHFLVRPRRQAQLKGDGLRVESPLGAIHRAVATLTRDQLDDGFDLIILACKAWDLGAAIEAIAPAMRGQARILPLLNGLAHLGTLDAAFGGEAVLGGLCQIAATLTPEGTIRHLNPFSALIFGPRQDSQRPLCEALVAASAGVRFDLRLSADIVQEMWEKWVLIATLAGATCLMRAPIGAIVAQPDGAALIEAMLAESQAIAASAGHEPRANVLVRFRGLLTEAGSPLAASMLRDVEAGNPVEVDHILGDLLGRADAAGLGAPLLHAARCQLGIFEAQRRLSAGSR
ncbi:2-dehydropantoate 2-reductase [uncultured Defluviicoccus sp.]|uniref:2-dehydropantoate 2-reductase n=1 Tax=metagenome TaxID=256318 RepID=A0A380TA80_9ZZZZ|nr:2-dehydropantoate 2-reductase [uncultured Defluviicoccus sp.]